MKSSQSPGEAGKLRLHVPGSSKASSDITNFSFSGEAGPVMMSRPGSKAAVQHWFQLPAKAHCCHISLLTCTTPQRLQFTDQHLKDIRALTALLNKMLDCDLEQLQQRGDLPFCFPCFWSSYFQQKLYKAHVKFLIASKVCQMSEPL